MRLKYIALLGWCVYATPVAAQCYQNGIVCSNTTNTDGSTITSSGSNNTVMIATNGNDKVPVAVDNLGQLKTVRSALPDGNNQIGYIRNSGFDVTGLLPNYATPPTVNIGSVNGLALDTSVNSLFKAGQSIGNSSFGASQTGLWNVGVTGSVTANIGTTNGLALDSSMNSLFKAGQNIGNITGTISLPNGAATEATLTMIASKLPSGLGSATEANSISIALASDGPIGQRNDAAATTTDNTPTSLISQTKQLVNRVNALITALGSPLQTGGNANVNIGLSANSAGGNSSTTVYSSTGMTFKNSAGNVASITIVTNAASGYLVGINTAAVPASGSAIAASDNRYCIPVGSNGGSATIGFDKVFQIPLYFSTGITWVFSTSCTTYTPATALTQMTVQFK